MTISEGDFIRATARWLFDGVAACQNTFWLTIPEDGGASQDNVRLAIRSYIQDVYNPILDEIPDNYETLDILLWNHTQSAPEPPISWSIAGGANAAAHLPEGCAALIYARTPVSRRIGRKFLPALVEGRADGGFWDATAMSALTSALNEYVSLYISGQGVYVLPGVLHIGVAPAEDEFSIFVSGVVSGQVAYQRRRKIGVGI